jgi:Skp family chaperone for outer membrane proteins
MRTILLAAGSVLAVLSTTAPAQQTAPTPPTAGCYIELQRLMAEPPSGIGDLGAAIHELDVKLRPQVEEINQLRAQIARLEQRSAEPAAENVNEALFEEESAAPQAAVPVADDRTAQQITQLQTDLDAKKAQLKLDYDAQRVAIVGPVQARVGQKVQAFATERGCAQVKMARPPDLEALRTAAAQDVTGDFVAWYLANRPA